MAILASPCTVRASSEDEREIEVPEPVEICLSCHTIKAGEPALEGPLLWGVVGRRVASLPDYEYSDALRRMGGNWDRERLDRWIAGPAAATPGTKMTLGGVRNAADRKIVLDFLETLRDGGDADDD
jgi:cytochrome c